MKIKIIILLASFSAIFIVSSIWLFSQANNTHTKSITPGENEDYITIDTLDRVDVTAPFDLSIRLDTHNKDVNTVGVYLEFDPQHLKILQMDSSESFCEFYPENKFDNQKGTIRLSCGAPHPGFNGKNRLLKIQLEPLIVGNSMLKLTSESMVLLNDGRGTNILTNFPAKEISILNTF